jgi:hypothetical protein
VDVAQMARCSESTVGRVENGDWHSVAYGRITAIADALGIRFEHLAQWRGAALDRALDEGHARLAGIVASLIGGWGWETRFEVGYSINGERGSIDILAWHPATGCVVVFEIKTELGSVEGLLRPLHVKTRLAARIAREQFGWDARSVSVVVVFPETMSVRRAVERHANVILRALPARSRAIRSWLQSPAGSLRGCWFLSDPRGTTLTRNPSSIRRIRRSPAASTERH